MFCGYCGKNNLEEASDAQGKWFDNNQTAIRLYERLAEQGVAHAQYKLSNFYAYGKGVKRDLKKSFAYLELAAKQNHPSAQYNLGMRYMLGKGIAKNFVEAFKWSIRAQNSSRHYYPSAVHLMNLSRELIERDVAEKWEAILLRR